MLLEHRGKVIRGDIDDRLITRFCVDESPITIFVGEVNACEIHVGTVDDDLLIGNTHAWNDSRCVIAVKHRDLKLDRFRYQVG